MDSKIVTFQRYNKSKLALYQENNAQLSFSLYNFNHVLRMQKEGYSLPMQVKILFIPRLDDECFSTEVKDLHHLLL